MLYKNKKLFSFIEFMIFSGLLAIIVPGFTSYSRYIFTFQYIFIFALIYYYYGKNKKKYGYINKKWVYISR